MLGKAQMRTDAAFAACILCVNFSDAAFDVEASLANVMLREGATRTPSQVIRLHLNDHTHPKAK